MEGTNEEIQYCFTKYAETALRRARRDYIKKEQKRAYLEEVTETAEELRSPAKVAVDHGILPIKLREETLLEPDALRRYIEEQVESRMKETLDCLTDREVLIVFLKVFCEMTFAEIGESLDLDWKKAASVYAYARKKLKKGWCKKNGI